MGVTVADADLDALDAFYRSGGAPPEVEVCPHADPSLLGGLRARGYVATGFRNVFGRQLTPVPPRAPVALPEVSVVVVDGGDDSQVERWSEVLLDGFGYPTGDARQRVATWNRMLAGRAEVDLLLACSAGRPVGASNVGYRGQVASLGGTTTLAEHRRCGVQGRLLRERLALAVAHGCSYAIVTADAGSISARNAQRAGFHLAYTNVRLRLAG